MGATGARERVSLVTGAAVVVVGVGVGVGVGVEVVVGVGVGVGVGHPGGMLGVAVAVGDGVGVGDGVTGWVGVAVSVGHTTVIDSVGNGSVALGEFSLGSGRADVAVPVGVVVGSAGFGCGLADEAGRLDGSGTGAIGW